MFNWFWNFLYSISSTIFRLIDGLMLCANKLCGIDPINFGKEKTDFLTYLLSTDQVGFAFRISAVLATILLIVFTVFAIIRSIAKDKAEGTPVQIAVRAFKSLLMFFFVPVVMFALIKIGNAFVTALYSATVNGSATPGSFLFSAFGQEGGMTPESVEAFRTGQLDYTNTSLVAAHLNGDISNFPFVFSWLAGGIVLFSIGSAMLVFVERVLSLIILYLAAPFSIATSVIDDGARFKLWRDQFLTKFIIGYGMIVAINIYAMVCGLITDPDFNFFSSPDDSFLNLLMKLLIIAGGAFTLQKSMALVGNLVSSGAGSNELRDSVSAGALARMAKGVAGSGLSAATTVAGVPFKPFTSIGSDALAMQSRHLGARLLRGMGLGGGYGKKTDKNGVEDPKDGSDSQNSEKANYGNDKDSAKAAIDPSFKTTKWDDDKKDDNANSNAPNNKNNDALSKAIQNADDDKENKQQQQQEGEGNQ